MTVYGTLAQCPPDGDVLYAPETASVVPRPMGRQSSPVQDPLIVLPGWEDSNKRVTFYCPTDLLAAIEAEMDRSRRSKTQVIVDCLRKDLERLA